MFALFGLLWLEGCGAHRQHHRIAEEHATYGPVLRELERSVSSYPARASAEDAFELVRAYATDLKNETLFIISNRIFAYRSFLHVSKRRKHAASLLSMARMGWALPNAAYAYNAASTGDLTEFARTDLPVAVISKKFGYFQPGIMVPNPFFAEGDMASWGRHCRELARSAAERPWPSRDPRLFWRGNVGNHVNDSLRDSGNFARLSALTLTAKNSSNFDVKCRVCRPLNESLHYDEAMRRLVRLRMQGVRDETFVDQKDYSRYQMLLNLPGTTAGGYSRNLNHLWILGSIVVQWNTTVVEFYTPGLKEGHTHVVIDQNNALEAVLAARDDRVQARRLRDSARRVHDTFLCPACQTRYTIDFLNALRNRFGLGLVLDDEHQRNSYLSPFCADDLVELVPKHPNSTSHRTLTVVERPRRKGDDVGWCSS